MLERSHKHLRPLVVHDLTSEPLPPDCKVGENSESVKLAIDLFYPLIKNNVEQKRHLLNELGLKFESLLLTCWFDLRRCFLKSLEGKFLYLRVQISQLKQRFDVEDRCFVPCLVSHYCLYQVNVDYFLALLKLVNEEVDSTHRGQAVGHSFINVLKN